MVDISKMVVPALIGGLVSGVLSAIPLISCGNILCCMWVILGGAIAAYFLAKKEKIELKDGAIVGALSGVIFAVVATLIGFVVTMVFTMLGIPVGGMGSDEMMGRMGMATVGVIWYLMLFFIYLVLGIIFSTAGGVIAAKLMEKK